MHWNILTILDALGIIKHFLSWGWSHAHILCCISLVFQHWVRARALARTRARDSDGRKEHLSLSLSMTAP